MLRCLKSSQFVETFALCKVLGVFISEQHSSTFKFFLITINVKNYTLYQVDIKQTNLDKDPKEYPPVWSHILQNTSPIIQQKQGCHPTLLHTTISRIYHISAIPLVTFVEYKQSRKYKIQITSRLVLKKHVQIRISISVDVSIA